MHGTGHFKAKKTILVVDDDQMVRHIARAIIEKIGYHVIEAESGEQAIDIARYYDGPIALAILDIVLPDIACKELFDILRQSRPDIKTLLSSGYNFNEIIRDLLLAGADGFIQKPYSFKSIQSKLKDILQE
ncbi:MAG: response regulator [Desulfobacterales bacterium]|nr:response regulator [Desulfobacterales bacterium]MDD4071751.1 response regulator [Desulfobacterales bacterium]MDD4391961.1 response regulator [Desulfobacterales bacterium]